MKKQFLSLLMALCLMLTLAPAAFATDSSNMIVGPDGQTYEIPDLTLAVSDDASANAGIATASVTYGGLGTASELYTVDSAEALYALATEKFNKTTVTYSYINITDDIDFSELTSTISEWNGYFKYFYGEIRGVSSDGTAPVIKGLPTNRFLIYGWCGGTIENLTIDPDGNAGILTFIPCKLNGSYGSFTVKNVTVSSDVAINLSEGDNQANYCPLIYAGAGTFSMTDCVIDANVRITGTTYGSLFHGYYPMDPTGSYTFTKCVNNGTLTMRHAAMFFGNNSAFTGSNKAYYAFNADDVSANRIRFSECVNNGKIYGTQTANLFATRASGNGAADEISDGMKII